MIEIDLRASGERAILTVADHGPGINLEDQKRVFEKFERIDKDKTQSGLGLGLFIVRQIVEMHSGTVDLESAPGEGAKFQIALPFVPLESL